MKDFGKYNGKRLCVATSGGADSTALLHFLKNREKEFGFFLSAVHCEHGIRGAESVEDMRFVERFCLERNIPLYIFREDCPARAAREKISLETAAREFRRECFSRLVQENKTDFIATAHHSGDEAETVLFRIARGSALAGACGMKEEEGFYLRPFLRWSKAEILGYVKENGLDYREDGTNADLAYTRNKLRLQVFPLLESAVAGAKDNFARFGFLAAEDEAYLKKQSEKLLIPDPENGRITVAFCEEKALFRRACLAAMRSLGCDRDYTSAHLESAFALQKAERGARLDMPKGVAAEKTETGVSFYRLDEREIFPPVENTEKPFGESGFDGGRYAVSVEKDPPKEDGGVWKILRLDKDKLPTDAVFRFRREGDRIEKFGGGSKSLKKFFNEKKLPVEERAYLPLLAARDSGEVYAVCGVEIAEKVKVTAETDNAVYLLLRKK